MGLPLDTLWLVFFEIRKVLTFLGKSVYYYKPDKAKPFSADNLWKHMRTAALLFAGSIGDHALTPLAGGASAWERSLDFVKNLPGLSGCLILEGGEGLPDGPFDRVRKDAWTVSDILEEAGRFVSGLEGEGEGAIDALVFASGDEPFQDACLAERILADYRRYRADYAFADGYPLGLAIEVLHPRILPALKDLAAKHPAGTERGWLFRLIQKDINAFDIETVISPLDMRELRLELACDTKRNKLLAERLVALGVHDAESALALIPGHLEVLRTLPAFVQVQVSGPCPQACAFCPYPVVGGDVLHRTDFMSKERFAAIAKAIADFSGDAVLDISLWGEPALHPDIEGLIDAALSHVKGDGLSLIVETSGIGWDSVVLERLAAKWQGRISWVVSLDAFDPESYTKFRGPGFDEARENALRLLKLFPASTYVQSLRTAEGEAGLEEFWHGWKKLTENVIVQKYSTFAGLLPERKVTDLSPLSRRPCWHLKRDLAILIDGKVPLCRDCARGEIMLGELFNGEEEVDEAELRIRLASIWEAGERYHRLHVAGLYPEPCAACDEYYTYNA